MFRRKPRTETARSHSSSHVLVDDEESDEHERLGMAWWMYLYMALTFLLLVTAVVLIAVTLADVEMFHHKVKDAVHKFNFHKLFNNIENFHPEQFMEAIALLGQANYGDHEQKVCKIDTHLYRPYGDQYLRLPYKRYRKGSGELYSDPNPRFISNYVMDYGKKKHAHETCDILPNDRHMSAWVWQWGQFIDHNFALTHAGEQYGVFEIDIKCDEIADPMCKGKSIRMTRSKYVDDKHDVRQQINELSSYLDASAVYGSTYERYHSLRAFEYGLLKVSKGDYMPYNEYGLPNAGGDDRTDLFLGGDVRANEQLGLTCTHTLWVREHNLWAKRLYKEHSDWNDEQLYWTARRIVTAEIQAITYNEFLPALLGKAADPKHYHEHKGYGMSPAKYSSEVSSDMRNEFATAGYRFGHSMVGDSLLLYNHKKHEHKCLPLKEAFFKPSNLHEYGMEPVLAGLTLQPSEEVDVLIVNSLRNFLHFAEFIDLASLNMMRGRDHGLPYYHELHYTMTGKYIKGWDDITKDKDLQENLKHVYHDWEHIDAWVGILAEDHIDDGSLGITGTAMIIEQFRNIRDSDPYYYEWDHGFPELYKSDVYDITLYDVIVRNSALGKDDISQHVFYVE